VRRIVLCGAVPGDGRGLAPRGVRRSPPFANLFTPDQDRARLAFIRDIHRYPGFHMASAGVTEAQKAAADGWLHGAEAAGHDLARVGAPALIGDGAEDPFDPVANSLRLAAQIPRAHLHIYADASHAFWYQDLRDWVGRVDRFLS
jgi:pimeloyl-ACP methyl ester carboxylesterase